MRRLWLACLLAAACVITLLAATVDRLPTGVGTTVEWSAFGAATVWQSVDDPIGTPDDDTTYATISEANGEHDFTYTAPAIPAGATVNKVTISARVEAIGSSWTHANRVKVGGANFNSGTASVSTTPGYADRVTDFTTNPATTLAWTVDEVNGTAGSNNLTEFGIVATGNTTAGDEARCTQVYMTIDYTEAAAGGWAPGSQQLLIRSGQ